MVKKLIKKDKKDSLKSVLNSGFVRSLSLPLICTFAGIAIVVIFLICFSYSTNLKSRISANKYEELLAIENTITGRLDEFDYIAADIYRSPSFLFANLPADKTQGYTMTSEVKRYLTGNNFLSYLIYYRTANPEKFFSSVGEFSTKNFWDAYLDFDGMTLEEFMAEINDSVRHNVAPMRKAAENKSYLTLYEPIPLASRTPQAFAIAFIEKKALNTYVESIFSNCKGEILLFDSESDLLYTYVSGADFDEEAMAQALDATKNYNQASIRVKGKSYVIQKCISAYDKWQVLAVFDSKTLFKEVYIAEAVMLMILAVVIITAFVFCFVLIARKFKPINQLAVSVMKDIGSDDSGVIDEHGLLRARFLSLFEEKKKMYTAIFFSNLLANQYDRALLEDALDEYNIEFHGNIFCPLVIMGDFDAENKDLASKIMDCAWECLNTENITSYIFLKMSPYSMVVCMNGQMDSLSYGNLTDMIRNLHEQILSRYGIEISVGIGNIMSDLLDFPKNVAQAVSAAFTCLQDRDAFFTEYSAGDGDNHPEEASGFISHLAVSIKQNNVKEVRASFSFLDEPRPNIDKSPILENYMAYSVSLMLLEYAKEAGEEERLDKVFTALSSGHANIDEIFTVIRDIAVDITLTRDEKSRRDREERSHTHELLNKIKKAIDERLCDSMLSLDALAEECGVSPSYLSRYFKQRMDCTPMAYVENARMDIAKRYLVTTDLSLDEVLERSGYIDKSNFIRKFKKREGMTPMSYRKAMSETE